MEEAPSPPHAPGDTFHPNGDGTAMPAPQPLNTKAKQPRSKKQLVIASVLIVLVIAGVMVWKLLIPAVQFRPATKVADQFVAALFGGNLQSAYDMTTESYRSTVKLSQLKRTVATKDFQSIDSKNIQLITKQYVGNNHNTAKLSYKFILNNREYFMIVMMAKTDSSWRVDKADLSLNLGAS